MRWVTWRATSGRYLLARHRMAFNSRNEGSTCAAQRDVASNIWQAAAAPAGAFQRGVQRVGAVGSRQAGAYTRPLFGST